ncbi:myelin transcription factor 1-like [Pyrus ussuriensis x Pyrus communis]|uniref:Myelin transcription factor 1-like n=1 Tax=Pyrus ussuriensis x Pyrus communis TaxID=2448454 RepID=A0A5N5GNR4_9ROSA|nr:myelin transcription factor 1-like [Pyrus ussuriensis x Pyrus communis]
MRWRRKKKLGDQRGCNGLDRAAQDFRTLFKSDNYIKNFVMEDNEEAANLRAAAIVYDRKLRGCGD